MEQMGERSGEETTRGEGWVHDGQSGAAQWPASGLHACTWYYCGTAVALAAAVDDAHLLFGGGGGGGGLGGGLCLQRRQLLGGFLAEYLFNDAQHLQGQQQTRAAS